MMVVFPLMMAAYVMMELLFHAKRIQMFILVKQPENIIVATAINPVSIEDASANGCVVYEVDDSEFTPDLLGSKLDYFELAKTNDL